MTVILVRHAKAGHPYADGRPDSARPLTAKGETQASQLVDTFADHDIGRVLSSPYLRCRQTVAPLASDRGLTVERCEEMAEGNGWLGLALIEELLRTGAGVVACTHGDVIEHILDGLAVVRDTWTRKGGAWLLEPGGAQALPPPS